MSTVRALVASMTTVNRARTEVSSLARSVQWEGEVGIRSTCDQSAGLST